MNVAAYLLESGLDDAPAIRTARGEWSYAELRRGVAAAMSRLEAQDLPPGSPVALKAPNGFFWVCAYLATLALGHVVVPIPAGLTAEEVGRRLDFVGCRTIFLARGDAAPDATPAGPLVVLAEDGSEPDGRLTLPGGPFDATRNAVYAFTSGTTGKPRVVRHTHQNIRANTESILGYLRLRPDDRMMVVLPFSYVFGASLLHTHLRVGASMVIQPSFAFPEAVVNQMEHEGCTGFAGVPSNFHLLLRSSSFAFRRLPALRTIQQAGGKLPPVLVEELIAAQPQADLFVMYGQTEATARLSYLPPDLARAKPGSVGKGIPGVDLQVLHEDGAAVAPGEVGEIWATGENISPGYLADPAATAAKFPGGRLRTGDLATIDRDGFIYIVDRREDFLKPWGIRVASQDIEAAAIRLQDLVAAAAVGLPDEAAGERIELVVVRAPGSGIDGAAVLDHCRRLLAPPMVPARVHFVERLPLNVNGKVAKGELRQWCLDRGAGPVS